MRGDCWRRGDQVFGGDGRPCRVTHKSREFSTFETTLYELHFDDGQVIEPIRTIDGWSTQTTTGSDCSRHREEDIARWKSDHLAWAASTRRLAAQMEDSNELHTYAFLGLLRSHGVTKWNEARSIGERLRAAGVMSSERSKADIVATVTCYSRLLFAEALETDADSPYGRVLARKRSLQRHQAEWTG